MPKFQKTEKRSNGGTHTLTTMQVQNFMLNWSTHFPFRMAYQVIRASNTTTSTGTLVCILLPSGAFQLFSNSPYDMRQGSSPEGDDASNTGELQSVWVETGEDLHKLPAPPSLLPGSSSPLLSPPTPPSQTSLPLGPLSLFQAHPDYSTVIQTGACILLYSFH